MQPYSSNYDYHGAYQNAVNAYNQSAWQSQYRQNELSNYRQGMEDPSKMYSRNLQGAQSMYGFDPQQLINAQKSLANTQTTIANLPQATQQQGNYYGTTAGALANNYAQQAGNLQGVLAGQSNAANAFQNVLGATQNQAQQQTQFGYLGQKMQTDILNQLVNAALTFQGQQQSQVGLAQGEQKNYGEYLNAQKQAQAQIVSAQAAMNNAAAAMKNANSTAALVAAQNAYNNAQAQYYNTLSSVNPNANQGLSVGTSQGSSIPLKVTQANTIPLGGVR